MEYIRADKHHGKAYSYPAPLSIMFWGSEGKRPRAAGEGHLPTLDFLWVQQCMWGEECSLGNVSLRSWVCSPSALR